MTSFFTSRIANTSVQSYVYYLLYLSMLPRSGLNEIKQRVQIYTHTIMKVKNKNQIINHEQFQPYRRFYNKINRPINEKYRMINIHINNNRFVCTKCKKKNIQNLKKNNAFNGIKKQTQTQIFSPNKSDLPFVDRNRYVTIACWNASFLNYKFHLRSGGAANPALIM